MKDNYFCEETHPTTGIVFDVFSKSLKQDSLL